MKEIAIACIIPWGVSLGSILNIKENLKPLDGVTSTIPHPQCLD